jgi:hypothetical protein
VKIGSKGFRTTIDSVPQSATRIVFYCDIIQQSIWLVARSLMSTTESTYIGTSLAYEKRYKIKSKEIWMIRVRALPGLFRIWVVVPLSLGFVLFLMNGCASTGPILATSADEITGIFTSTGGATHARFDRGWNIPSRTKPDVGNHRTSDISSR